MDHLIHTDEHGFQMKLWSLTLFVIYVAWCSQVAVVPQNLKYYIIRYILLKIYACAILTFVKNTFWPIETIHQADESGLTIQIYLLVLSQPYIFNNIINALGSLTAALV